MSWARPRRVLAWVAAALAATVVLGNVAIAAAWKLAEWRLPPPHLQLAGIRNEREVTPELWRGNAPTPEGYAALADAGVRTVIDLRAERRLEVDRDLLEELGIERVRFPVRDGQPPPPDVLERILTTVQEADGAVYLHCGAGVGRTGSTVAAYLVRVMGQDARRAMVHSLAVGPPSLEQIAFMLQLDRNGSVEMPGPAVTALSRFLDAPRRIYARLRGRV